LAVVREADRADTMGVLTLIQEFSDAAAADHLWVDQEKAVDLVESLLEAEDAVIFVADDDGESVGFIVGFLGEILFNKVKYSTELAWFVRPEHRGGTVALRLLKAYEEWGKSKGVHIINMADMSILQDHGGLYEKLGYSKVETCYVKKTENAQW